MCLFFTFCYRVADPYFNTLFIPVPGSVGNSSSSLFLTRLSNSPFFPAIRSFLVIHPGHFDWGLLGSRCLAVELAVQSDKEGGKRKIPIEMAGGSDVVHTTLTCFKCGKPAHLQDV